MGDKPTSASHWTFPRQYLCSRTNLAIWTTLWYLMLGAGGLTIDTPSPDALCPPLAQTRSSVEARLGAVELEGTWRATYVLVHRAEGDRLTLRLQDPSGAVRLEREFSAEGGSCAALAQVIALVLERYFLRLESHPEPTTDSDKADDAASVTSVPTRATQGSVVPPASERSATPISLKLATFDTDQRRARPSTRSRLGLDAGLFASTAWVAPSVGAAFRSQAHWSLGLSTGYDLSDHESPILTGWGSSRRLPILLQFKRQWTQQGSMRLDWGADLLGLYERVQTVGLFHDGAASRFVPGIGLRLGMELLPEQPKIGPFVEFSTAMLLRWLSRPYEVDHAPVFPLPIFVLGLHFGIRTIL